MADHRSLLDCCTPGTVLQAANFQKLDVRTVHGKPLTSSDDVTHDLIDIGKDLLAEAAKAADVVPVSAAEVRRRCLQELHDAKDKMEATLTFDNFSEESKADPEIVLAAITRFPGCLIVASPECRNDRNFALKAIELDPRCLQYVGDSCRDDPELVMRAVERDPRCLQWAGDLCRNDRAIVQRAVELSVVCLQYAGKELRDDRALTMQCLFKDPVAARCVEPRIDEDVGLSATWEKAVRWQEHRERCRGRGHKRQQVLV